MNNTQSTKPGPGRKVTAAMLLFGAILASCASSTLPRLSRLHTGMSLENVFELYQKLDPMDPQTSRYLPASEPLTVRQDRTCIFETYRFWLNVRGQPRAHLLEFKSCKLTKEAQDAIRKRAYKKAMKIAGNPYVDREDLPAMFRLIEAAIPDYSRSVLVAIKAED